MKYLAMMCFISAIAIGVYNVAIVSKTANAEENKLLRVAVVDTGLNYNPKISKLSLCDGNQALEDYVGHGTKMATLIYDTLTNDKKTSICFISTSIMEKDRKITSASITRGILEAIAAKADIINLSLQEETFTYPMYKAVKLASDSGAIIFVAAGNWGINLNDMCNVYPACFRGIKNMHVVGQYGISNHAVPQKGTNFGSVVSLWYDGSYGMYTGTSAATARATADYINGL